PRCHWSPGSWSFRPSLAKGAAKALDHRGGGIARVSEQRIGRLFDVPPRITRSGRQALERLSGFALSRFQNAELRAGFLAQLLNLRARVSLDLLLRLAGVPLDLRNGLAELTDGSLDFAIGDLGVTRNHGALLPKQAARGGTPLRCFGGHHLLLLVARRFDRLRIFACRKVASFN